MPITINGHEYDDEILAAAQTAKQYDETHKQVESEIKAEPDPAKKHALAYGNWMRSRRSGSYNHYSVRQKQEIHEVARISYGRLVCVCGLISEVSGEDPYDEVAFWNAPGHLAVSSRSIVTLFVVRVWVSKALGLQAHYWCQSCGDIGNTIPTKTGNVSVVGLKAIRASHQCTAAKR